MSPIVEAIGLGAAIDYINSIGKVQIRKHESVLLPYAQERLADINCVRMIGAPPKRGRSFPLI
ncbi:hypothetical protein XI09_07695 [Bradyrhizobium sp. CCBAU 11386]|nr:hypothetical protein [Bradyrhizobium sp. CCBAU 11386]